MFQWLIWLFLSHCCEWLCVDFFSVPTVRPFLQNYHEATKLFQEDDHSQVYACLQGEQWGQHATMVRRLVCRWNFHEFGQGQNWVMALQMGVSKNRVGPPKSSILLGFGTIIFTIHFGGSNPPIVGNTQIHPGKLTRNLIITCLKRKIK